MSKAQLQRCLRILQGLFAEAERRGYEVRSYAGGYEPAGVSIAVCGHDYPLKLSELNDHIPLTEEDRKRWHRDNDWRLRWHPDLSPPESKLVANGRLKLSLPSGGRRSTWSEGPRGPLEAKLGGVFEELERRAEEDDRRAEERGRAHEERMRAEEERREQQRLQALEQARVERLLEQTQAWRRAAEVRAFVAAIRERVGALTTEERVRLDEWCEWAERWAELSDPTRAPAPLTDLEEPR